MFRKTSEFCSKRLNYFIKYLILLTFFTFKNMLYRTYKNKVEEQLVFEAQAK